MWCILCPLIKEYITKSPVCDGRTRVVKLTVVYYYYYYYYGEILGM
jgi:hypothetical protein